MVKGTAYWRQSLSTNVGLTGMAGFALLAIALVAVGWNRTAISAAATGDPIKVGVISNLTGPETASGEGTVRGIEIALDEINAAGGINGRKLEAIVEDSEYRPATGLAAAHKLIDVNKVPVILFSTGSGVLLPIGEYAKQQNVIIMNPGGSSPLVRKLKGTIFSIIGLDDVVGKELGKWVYERGFRNAALLNPNSPYGTELGKAAAAEFKRQGGAVAASIDYEQNQSDYRPDLQRIADKKPDVIMSATYGDDAKLLFKQAIQIGITVPWYILYPITLKFEDPTQAVGRVFGLELGFDLPTAGKFNDKYTKRYGARPAVPNAVYSYDGAWLVALAMREAGTDPNKIRQALPKVAMKYNGATGKVVFDSDGQRTSAPYLRLKMTGDGTFDLTQ